MVTIGYVCIHYSSHRPETGRQSQVSVPWTFTERKADRFLLNVLSAHLRL